MPLITGPERKAVTQEPVNTYAWLVENYGDGTVTCQWQHDISMRAQKWDCGVYITDRESLNGANAPRIHAKRCPRRS